MASLSVLITYHNEGAWLRACIESVQSQPGAPDEILVYDDASTIPAADHVPPGVVVIRGDSNIGPARGRNILLDRATSDYVHIHDADDLFAPTWCAEIRAALLQHDVVITDVARFGESPQPHVMGVASITDPLSYAIRGAVLIPSMTYRRSVAPRFNPDLHQSEDWEYHVRLLASVSSDRVALLGDDLVSVRAHRENRSRDTVAVWSDALAAIEQLELPARCSDDLAYKAMIAGRTLYRAGEVAAARRAFDVARKKSSSGVVPFEDVRMRLLARVLGPIGALRVRY